MHDSLTAWAARLRAAATAGLAGSPLEWLLAPAPVAPADAAVLISRFRDNAGHRRPVDPAVLAWMVGVPPVGEPSSPAFDVACWWGLHSGSMPRCREHGPLIPAEGVGPDAAPWDGRASVELWTESELCALHALWNHALLADRRGDKSGAAALLARARSAVDWYVRELQPDNATGHPWGVQVFAWAGATHSEPVRGAEADLYAQALLNNARVAGGGGAGGGGGGRGGEGGVPDTFSACILLDAARGLERHGHERGGVAGATSRSRP